MGRWRERHPEITLELHASQQMVDLQREGFHAALRVGAGHWRGLQSVRLMDSPIVAVASPVRAARLAAGDMAAIAAEPLLGPAAMWERWLGLGGQRLAAKPVAEFNDAGLMLQAVEQDIGIALARGLLAADALQAGRLVQLSPLALADADFATYWLVHPPELDEWPPLVALRDWLFEEMASSRQALDALQRS
ncbi:MAG TPA: LysR substrate-binding domain-containing protein, partial [Rubrivivax sp.]|nr:LysR substrate-binding domain-containing protein [Rubrivivax sp.]